MWSGSSKDGNTSQPGGHARPFPGKAAATEPGLTGGYETGYYSGLEGSFMIVESVKYMLMAQNMDRAIRFYRDVVGLEVKFESPEWTELTFGDAIVALHGGGTGAYQKTGLSLQVKNIASACKEIEAGGGKVASPPMARPGEPIKLAEVLDTEGNAFSLSEYIG